MISPIATSNELELLRVAADMAAEANQSWWRRLLHPKAAQPSDEHCKRAENVRQTMLEERMAVRRFLVFATLPQPPKKPKPIAGTKAAADNPQGQKKTTLKKKTDDSEPTYEQRLGTLHRQLDSIYDVAYHMGGDTFHRWQHLMANCIVAEMGMEEEED